MSSVRNDVADVCTQTRRVLFNVIFHKLLLRFQSTTRAFLSLPIIIIITAVICDVLSDLTLYIGNTVTALVRYAFAYRWTSGLIVVRISYQFFSPSRNTKFFFVSILTFFFFSISMLHRSHAIYNGFTIL